MASPWYTWTSAISNGSTTSTGYVLLNDVVWHNWTADTNSTTSSNIVWRNWTQQTGTIFVPQNSSQVQLVDCSFTHPSPEDRRRHRRLQGIRQARRLSANHKARALLHSVLSAEQRAQLEAQREFVVCGRGGRRFRVKADHRVHNVFELDEHDRSIREFCIYAPNVPQDDHLAAQVLMLKTDIEEFERGANIWDLRSAARPLVSPSGRPLVLA
jgi:hypothetical protein